MVAENRTSKDALAPLPVEELPDRVVSRGDVRRRPPIPRPVLPPPPLDTIGSRYDRGQTNGFDYLRIILSVAVVCIHTVAVSYGKSGEAYLYEPPYRGLVTLILPAFFALSGFLVSGSLVRMPDIVRFLSLRVIRLIPALAVEVVLCALLLGPLFTTLPLSDYVRNPQSWSYCLNIIGLIHFRLPGVFDDNPFNLAVNASLWTVPYELECYFALTIIAVVGLLQSRRMLLGAIVLAHVALFLRDMIKGGADLPIDGALPGRVLVLSFLAGVALFMYRDVVVVRTQYVVAALIGSYVMLSVPYAPYFVAPLAAYATVCVGLSRVSKNRLVASGDYSYGMYIYAFPIQQTIAHLFPATREWYLNLLISLPITCVFAAASWHLVEKHALKLKRYVKR